MKKVFGSLSVLMSIGLVSAQDGVAGFIDNIPLAISGFFDAVYLHPQGFSRLLLGILLFMVVYGTIKKMEIMDDGIASIFISTIAALIITWLTFAGLPDNFVNAILLKYGAVGGSILAAIPFIIIFYFTNAVLPNLFLSYVVWVIYILYYFSLFIAKLVGNDYKSIGTALATPDNIPYIAAIILGIIFLVSLKWTRKQVFTAVLDSKFEKGQRQNRKAAKGRELDAERVEETG